jgi:glycosyltransferase 2 family protein
MTVKDILKYAISLAVAGGLLWLTFRNIDLGAMFATIQQANPVWIGLYAVVILLAHWSRGIRWSLLLEPVTGQKPSTTNTTLGVLTGYFANLLVPRMGEVTRCGTLNRLEGVPVNVSFGTVVAERIFDVLMLLVIIGLTLVLEFERLSGFIFGFFGQKTGRATNGGATNGWATDGGAGNGGATNGQLLLILGIVAVVGLGLAVWLFNRFRPMLRQNTLYLKVESFAVGLLEGLLSIRKLKQPGVFIFHTVLIWVLYYLSTYVLFFALPQTAGLGPLAALTILMMGSIGMAAPTQGGLGSFNIMVGSALALYGLTQQDGQTLATLMLLSQWVFVILYGGISFLIVLTRRQLPSAVI